MALFSQSEVEPDGVDGLAGKGLTVTDKESELILFPQEFTPLTEILAIPENDTFHVMVEFTEVPEILPAVVGEILHK